MDEPGVVLPHKDTSCGLNGNELYRTFFVRPSVQVSSSTSGRGSMQRVYLDIVLIPLTPALREDEIKTDL